MDTLFKEEKLFHTLEKLFSSASRNSLSNARLEYYRNQDPDYSEIKKSVQKFIYMFQKNSDNQVDKDWRERSFFYLDFIQNNYGFEIFQLEKGEKFEEKMSFMSSSFQLGEQLDNIYMYMQNEELIGGEIPEYKKNQYGEKILLIYKFLESLISKHRILFLNSEMKAYCRTTNIQFLKDLIEGEIDKVINQYKYYLHL